MRSRLTAALTGTGLVSGLLLLLAVATPMVAAYRVGTRWPHTEPGAGWVKLNLHLSDRPSGWGRLQEIVFVDGAGVYVPGGVGTLRSADGTTWRIERPGGTGIDFNEYGVGLLAAPAQISRSTDWGSTWERVFTSGAARVRFVDDESAIAVGPAGVVLSDDAGLTWTPLDMPPGEYRDVRFVDGKVGLAVGGPGLIARTTDGGRTWNRTSLRSSAVFRGVAFIDLVNSVAVGSDGAIFRSEDGGLSWVSVPSGTGEHLSAVAFTNESDGLAVGFYGTLLRTDDAGRSWRVEPSGTRNHLLNLAISPDDVPIVIGWYGTVLEASTLPVEDHEEGVLQ